MVNYLRCTRRHFLQSLVPLLLSNSTHGIVEESGGHGIIEGVAYHGHGTLRRVASCVGDCKGGKARSPSRMTGKWEKNRGRGHRQAARDTSSK